MSNANILYTQPTLNKDYTLEDYSIVVNLQVEIVNRNNQTINSEKEKISYEYVFSSNDDLSKDYKSFLDGQSMTFQHGNGVLTKKRYLSTNGYDYSKIEDLSTDNGSSECFGIKSIDIAYNNYMIPEVTIEFIDIRGISLFIPEDMKHVKNSDGIRYSSDDNISGSFFRAFFIMPYPKFKLMVKGFYGQALSYTLFCSDFRARFDCTTGNFAATARFVGYTLSLLNDITLNTILVAPYSEYHGKSYWNNKINNDFMIDGKPMPTLIEIIEKYNKLKENFNTTNINNPLFSEMQSINYDLMNLDSFIKSFKLYYLTLVSYFSKKNTTSDFTFKYIENDYTFILLSNNTNFDLSDDINIKYNFNNLKEAKGLYNKLDVNIDSNWPNDTITLSTIDDSVKSKFKDGEFKNYGLDILSEYTNIYIFNGKEFYNLLENNKKLLEDKLSQTNKDLTLQTQEKIIDALGFNPTVKNITYIILAHLETLIYTLYRCSDEVNKLKRTQDSLNLYSSDINFEKVNNVVSIFPKVELIKSKNNSLRTIEEGWVGNLRNGEAQPEYKLINSLLNGVNDVSSKIELFANNTTNSTNKLTPLIPLDLFNKKEYFIKNINFNDISEFFGAIGFRLCQLFGYNKITSSNARLFGSIDALNFYYQYPSPSPYFLKRLNDENISSYLYYLKCLSNNSDVSNEKVNGQWCWESINDKMFTYFNSNTYYYSLDKKLLPYTDLTWDDIKKHMSNEKKLLSKDNINNYILINEDIYDNNDNICIIDSNYENYVNLQPLNKTQIDNIEFTYDFNTVFNLEKYIGDYYNDKQIMPKFIKLYNVINFTQSSTNNLLPENDTSYINSFDKERKYDNDFSFIYIYQSENEDKKYEREFIKNNTIKSLSDIEQFTIGTFNGIIDDEVEEDISIFGQSIYYAQKTDYAKALLFLIILNESYIKYDDVISNFKKNSLNNSILYLPYISILLFGGIFYYRRIGQEEFGLNFSENEDLSDIISEIYDSDMPRKEIRNIFENEFIKWVNDTYGFKYLQRYLELHNKNFKTLTLQEFNDLIDKLSTSNPVDYVKIMNENLHSNFFKIYISFKLYEDDDIYNLKLYNRETSSINNFLMKFLFQPCFVCKFTTNTLNKAVSSRKPKDSSTLSLNTVDISEYYISFIDKIKRLYNVQSYNDIVDYNLTSLNNNNIKDDIKITYYKYLKIIWDRWLNNNDETNWYLNNFSKHWYFIDAFYNKIGEDVLINVENLSNIIFYSQNQETYSLLSFLSNIYSKDKLMFHTVQNFFDIVDDKKGYDNMMKLFKAIPYNEIDFQDNYIGDFIVMYPYEFSSKLSLKDDYFINDSYNLDDDDSQLPLQIVTKNSENGYKIPAFNVIYGNQEQKYFNNIDVNMDNPICTEQSLMAQYSIATYNNKNIENNKNAVVLGQDLYTIYSNNSYTCTIQMMGCAWIQPLMYFQLSSIPLFKGAYLIEKVKHHIEPGNMVTEFIGVRMRKDVTNIMQNPYYYPIKNDVGSSGENQVLSQDNIQSINVCGYKFYEPIENVKDNDFNTNILSMTLIEYSNYIKVEWDNSNVLSKFDLYTTQIIDLLTSTILSKIQLNDYENDYENLKTTLSLCATVIYNNYLANGNNFIKLSNLYDSILSIDELVNNGVDFAYIEECRKIITDIFSQTPIKIIGQKCFYYENNEKKNYIITTDIIKVIDYFGSLNLMFLSKIKCKSNNFLSFYALQNKEYSTYDTSTDKEGNIINSLCESIKKTLSSIDSINYSNIKFNVISNNLFEISYDKNVNVELYYGLLDVIIIAYYNYFTSCIYTENEKITISSSYANNKKISIVDANNVLLTKESLNDLYYKTIYKKFNKIDYNNQKEFISTFTNFNCTVDKTNELITFVNKKISRYQSENCTYDYGTNQTDGYTWDGTSHKNNSLSPSIGKFKTFNASLLGENAYNAVIEGSKNSINGCDIKPKNKSCHRCAAWVKSAILKTINNDDIGNYPYSACVYERFLPSWGFEKIYESASHTLSSYKPINGDISVIAGKINNINDTDESSRHGHIQVYYNGCWYSDFECKTAWTYSDNRPFKIFRWKS